MKANQFNDHWQVKYLGERAPGVPISLPHDAMLSEPRTELSAGGINTGWYEGRDYLYTKVFTPDRALTDQCAVLEFEGVYHNAEVWLNGEELAFRPYGYTNFYVELTGKLRAGEENTLEVIARNADQPNSRWYSGAGIYRPVVLWTADREHIKLNGVKIRTLSLDPAQIEVRVETEGAGPVSVAVLDDGRELAAASGETKGQFTFTMILEGAKPWSLDDPQLYACRIRFGTDEVVETFGLRTLEWGRRGLLLNGERVIVQGACIHHDNGVLGACCYEDAEWRKIRILKENGYNAIRSAHNPCSKFLLDACDHLGVLVMDEYIDHWYIHKTEHDYVDYFMEWWKQDLKDMVAMLRSRSDGRPIGIKIAAGRIERDLEYCVYAEPDFITIDGRGGATGASPAIIRDSTSVPTIYALYRARKYLDLVNADIDLVITGGLRVSSDFAKAIAMGADAVAIASAAMVAAACQQYRICGSGMCPVGMATQDPELRTRLKTDAAAKRVANFLNCSAEELRTFARITGHADIHELSVEDLCTISREISENTNIEHA